jgi:hypothetical protein
MASSILLAQQAAARDDFQARIAAVTHPSFVKGRLATVLPHGAGRDRCRGQVVQNDGTGPATVALDFEGGVRAYAKFYRDDSGEHCFRVLSTLWADGFGPRGRYRVAEPLAFFPDVNMLLLRAAPGVPLGEAVSDGHLTAGAIESARWLARLHQSSVRIGTPRYPWDVYHKLLHRLAKAAAAHPDRVDVLLDLADRLEGASRRLKLQLVQAHGQFRHIHVFIAADSVSVIDLDRSRPGDPARDVGEFIHRMRAKHYKATGGASRADAATSAFLEEYSRYAPKYLVNLPFYWGFHAVVSLWRFMKASTPQHPDWDRLTAFYLSEFDRALSFSAGE